jgi:protoporphyrinogen oxidase
MDNCTVTIHPPTGRKRLLGDALRSPQYLLPTLKSIGIRDGLRFFKWRLGTSSRDLERSLDAPSLPISQALSQRRFRPSTQRVLEPLFAGITLDPTLSERFAFADFTWGAMAHGTMVVPQRGIGAVPQQLADRLRSTKILLNTEITDVSEKSVVANGATHAFDLVILAVPQHVAARLLPKTLESHRPVERLTSTVVFAASRPPFKHARLLLNETWGINESQVLHVHVPTNLHPHPQGHHWIAATLVGKAAEAPDSLSVQKELKGWFGRSTEQWEHVYTTTVRHALPHIDPEHHHRVLPDLELDGVLVVGDHRTHPSVQGALASAERALSHLGIPLPTR